MQMDQECSATWPSLYGTFGLLVRTLELSLVEEERGGGLVLTAKGHTTTPPLPTASPGHDSAQ